MATQVGTESSPRDQHSSAPLLSVLGYSRPQPGGADRAEVAATLEADVEEEVAFNVSFYNNELARVLQETRLCRAPTILNSFRAIQSRAFIRFDKHYQNNQNSKI